MQRLHLLESKNFVAGGNVQVSLRDLPGRHIVKGFLLRLEAVVTQAAGAPLIPGDVLCTIFQNIEVSKRVKGTGRFFEMLNWIMRGNQLAQPADVPAAGAGAYRRTITAVIPYSDIMAASTNDAAPLSDFFRDTPIIVDFLNPTASWNANTSVAGTLRSYAIVEPVDQGVAPSALQLGYTDWAGQQPQLEGGYLYTHAWLMKDTASVTPGANSITSLEVTGVSVTVDGTRLVDLAKAEEMAFLQDYQKANGAGLRTLSATAPVAGEGLTDEPAATVGAAATVTMEMVPLLVTQHGYKLSNAYDVEKGIRIDFTGSLTNFRIGWRRIEARSADSAVRAMQKAGVLNPNPDAIRAKTASKKELTPAKAKLIRYLPLRHE